MGRPKDQKNQSIPIRLRKLAAERDLTQKEIAASIGVSPQSISQYLDGSVNPSYSALVALAELFGVSTDYILGRTEVETSDTLVSGAISLTGLSEKAIAFLTSSRRGAAVLNTLLESAVSTSILRALDSLLAMEYYRSIYSEKADKDIPDWEKYDAAAGYMREMIEVEERFITMEMRALVRNNKSFEPSEQFKHYSDVDHIIALGEALANMKRARGTDGKEAL